jgi:hypothetical protein
MLQTAETIHVDFPSNAQITQIHAKDDFNKDGVPDIVVTSPINGGRIVILESDP